MICIIGAGPAGSYLAQLLAKAGENVSLFEASEIIGAPVQCTGIVTNALFTLVKQDKKYMTNTLNSARIHGPTESATLPLREYVICRQSFDQHLAHLAQDAGTNIHTGHRFIKREGNKAIFRHKGKRVEMHFDTLVGADGPHSTVARTAGLSIPRRHWIGLQATLRGCFDPKCFSAHFGDCAPGFFGWIVPESEERARVGIATEHHAREHFNTFIKHVGGDIIAQQAGPIPMYASGARRGNPEKSVFLVGDAAGVVKATTGGGIITSMLSSKALAASLLNGRDYEKELRPLRKELWLHQWIRAALNTFSDADYDRLICLMRNERVKAILRDHPREFPSAFLLKLVRAEPRLLGFAGRAIKSIAF